MYIYIRKANNYKNRDGQVMKSTQSIAPKLIKGGSRENGANGKRGPRFYTVRVFYAVFFGAAAIGFAFQSVVPDDVDMALIGFCTLASLVSFMSSVKPPQED